MPWLNRVDADWLEQAVRGARAALRAGGSLAGRRPRRRAATRASRAREIVAFGVEGWPACGTPTGGASPPRARRSLGCDANRGADRRPGEPMSSKSVWVVLPDQLSTRLFVDTGILTGLSARLDGDGRCRARRRRSGLAEGDGRRARPIDAAALAPANVSVAERLHRSVDRRLDRWIGYYPLAIRLNLRHGFHRERMAPGHENWMLDSSRVGSAPALGPARAAHGRVALRPHALRAARASRADAPRLRAHSCCRTSSRRSVVPFLVAARRLAHSDRRARRELGSHGRQGRDRAVLRRLHRPERDDAGRPRSATTTSTASEIVVTGWPQTDVYARRRDRVRSSTPLVRSFGLDPALPLVVVMGNTPTNAPFEDRFVERVVRWWEAEGRGRMSLLFRPHPRDRAWEERFAGRARDPGRARPGGELHGPRGAGDDPAARRVRRRERRDDPARGDRQRPPGRLRALRRGRTAGRELGDEERHRRALPRARAASEAFYRAERFEDVVVRHRALARRILASSPRSAAASSRRSSARSTGARRSASWRQSWTSSRRERTAPSSLQLGVRVGVVACAAAACLIGAGRLDDAVAVFDFHADANDAATYSDRTYPGIEWLPGGAAVMEDARLWMPETRRYRVVHRSRPDCGADGRRSLRHFLLALFLPRRETEHETARWVFCYDCTPSVLGPRYEVLSDSGRGIPVRKEEHVTLRAIGGLFVLNVFILGVGAGVLWGLRGWRWWTDVVRLAGVAYLLGWSALMIVMTCELVLGVPIGAVTVLLDGVGIAALGVLVGRRRGFTAPTLRPPSWRFPRLSLLAALFVAGIVVYVEGTVPGGSSCERCPGVGQLGELDAQGARALPLGAPRAGVPDACPGNAAPLVPSRARDHPGRGLPRHGFRGHGHLALAVLVLRRRVRRSCDRSSCHTCPSRDPVSGAAGIPRGTEPPGLEHHALCGHPARLPRRRRGTARRAVDRGEGAMAACSGDGALVRCDARQARGSAVRGLRGGAGFVASFAERRRLWPRLFVAGVVAVALVLPWRVWFMAHDLAREQAAGLSGGAGLVRLRSGLALGEVRSCDAVRPGSLELRSRRGGGGHRPCASRRRLADIALCRRSFSSARSRRPRGSSGPIPGSVSRRTSGPLVASPGRRSSRSQC